MTQLTLRNITTDEDIIVPPEGFIFGRVGGDADVQLEDKGISRRQARVSWRGGRWLLEMLAVPQGARAPRPLALEQSSTFAVGRHEFEVLEVGENEEAESEEELDPSAKTVAPRRGQPGAPVAPPKRTGPAAVPAANARSGAAPGKRPSGPAPVQPTETATPKESPAPKAAAKPPPPPPVSARAEKADAADDETEDKGFGAMFVAVPKGLAYYLLSVPKLLANPLGTVRSTIENLPAEPMGKIELIGYALPALLATGMLGSIAGGLALLIAPPHTFSLMSFIPIVPAIGAVIGAIITGYIWHPVLSWVITKLKGNSDARSRTNYLLQMMTLSIVLAVPNALGTLLGALPIPFINLLGPLLMVVASLVSFYVLYQWLVLFDVVKWLLTVVKVLAVLSVLGAAWGLVSGVIATVRNFGSGSTASASASTADAEAAVAIAAAEAQAAAAGADMPPEAQKALEEAKARAADAMKDAKAAAEAAGQKADTKPANADVEQAPAPAPVAVPAAAEVPTKAEPSSGAYGTYARRRDAIEKLFERDPTVLQRNRDAQKLYGEYSEAAFELDKKWGKETAKNPELGRLHNRLKEAELFERSQKTINSLAGKLGVP